MGLWALIVWMTAASVGSTPPRLLARLEYQRTTEAAACPGETELRNLISARLGYEPWRQEAPLLLRVAIVRDEARLKATVELSDDKGSSLGRRVLLAPAIDCQPLTDSLQLALAIALDPLFATPPAPPPPAPPAPPPSPPAPPLPPPPPTPPPALIREPIREPSPAPVPLRLSVGVGGAASSGLSLAPTGGGVVRVALHREALFVALEGRVDWPAYLVLPDGRVSGQALAGQVLGGRHMGAWSGSLFAGAAQVRLSTNRQQDVRDTTRVLGLLGLRLTRHWALSEAFSIRLGAEVGAHLGRILLRDARTQERLWSSPAFGGALLLGVDWRLP